MRKFMLFLLCNFIWIMLLSGCSTQNISDSMKDSGFEIVGDVSILEQDVKDWANTKESSTGIYNKKFSSGSYLLISLGSHKRYAVKKIDVQKDNCGYLFNVTVAEPKLDNISDDQILVSPILVKTSNSNENYDIKIIYP